MELYDRMLNHFGAQHWWPGETALEVMVGAVLTQNTNWKNVEKAIDMYKAADKLPEHLLAADPEDRVATVEKAEKGLEKANERNAHRQTGQDNAAEARERRSEMKEKAKENQENRGRSEDHPTPPEAPPGRN